MRVDKFKPIFSSQNHNQIRHMRQTKGKLCKKFQNESKNSKWKFLLRISPLEWLRVVEIKHNQISNLFRQEIPQSINFLLNFRFIMYKLICKINQIKNRKVKLSIYLIISTISNIKKDQKQLQYCHQLSTLPLNCKFTLTIISGKSSNQKLFGCYKSRINCYMFLPCKINSSNYSLLGTVIGHQQGYIQNFIKLYWQLQQRRALVVIQLIHISIDCILVKIININKQRMSRHRRANSDLYGLKTLKTTKSSSFKEQETVISNHNLSAYEPKSSTSKKSNCPETPSKKQDSQEMIIDTYKLLKHFYKNEDSDYYERTKKYLNGEWETHKKNFIEHYNKLSYVEQEMRKKNYHQIQLQIVAEWRKNPVLYCIRAFWYEHILSIKFLSITDFMRRYNTFKDFVGQLAFLYFKRFFLSLGPQQIQKILDKLTERTSHLIITYTTSWCKFCDKVFMPLLKQKLSIAHLEDVDVSKFDLQKMEIKTIAVDMHNPQLQMPKTVDSIQKFTMEHKILQKMKLLLDTRQHMEQQIRKRQENLIKLGQIKSVKVLDKDDFVDCLVYCVVKGDISLEKLGLSIKYFYYILGPDATTLLSKFRCDPYLADLQAVYDFLMLEAKKIIDKQNNSESINHQSTQ